MSDVDVPGVSLDFGYNDTPAKAISSAIAQHTGLGHNTSAKFKLDSVPSYLSAEIGLLNEYDWDRLAETENGSPTVRLNSHPPTGEQGVTRKVIKISDIWVTCDHADGKTVDVKFKVTLTVPESLLSGYGSPYLSYKWEAERISTEPHS